MKPEQINLMEIETHDGFIEILDLEKVNSVTTMIDYSLVRLENGLLKCVKNKYGHEIQKFLQEGKCLKGLKK